MVKLTKAKTFQAYLDSCHRRYSCVHCRAHLANHDELISKVATKFVSSLFLGRPRQCSCWNALLATALVRTCNVLAVQTKNISRFSLLIKLSQTCVLIWFIFLLSSLSRAVRAGPTSLTLCKYLWTENTILTFGRQIVFLMINLHNQSKDLKTETLTHNFSQCKCD